MLTLIKSIFALIIGMKDVVRKPKPGMLYQAQKEYNLNLTKCILIGDDERDIEAGEAAGCITYMVTEDRSILEIVKELVKKE